MTFVDSLSLFLHKCSKFLTYFVALALKVFQQFEKLIHVLNTFRIEIFNFIEISIIDLMSRKTTKLI